MVKKYIDATLTHWAATGKKVFKHSELSDLYLDLQSQRKIPKSLTLSSYVKKLIKETGLKKEKLSFPSRTEKRYLLDGYSIYELVFSLRNGA